MSKKPVKPDYIRNKADAATTSKFNTSYNNNSTNTEMSSGVLSPISKDIEGKLSQNSSIMDLFPDVELAMQILVSSILSPNDMIKNPLNYIGPDLPISSQLKSNIVSTIKKHMNEEYSIDDELYGMLKESLFTKGSYVQAIIPEASVDDVINKGGGQVSLESKEDVFDHLSRDNYTLSKTKRDFNFGISNEDSYDKNEHTITANEDDLMLDIIENPTALKANDIFLNAVSHSVTEHYYGSSNYSELLQSNEDDATVKDSKSVLKDLDDIFKNSDNLKEENRIDVPGYEDASRRSVGKPLLMKLTTESTIPVHATNDVTRHLGYFVMLDENGAPISYKKESKETKNNELKKLIEESEQRSRDTKMEIIKKAKDALFGMTKKDVVVPKMEKLYGEMVDATIKKRLNDGVYRGFASLEKDNDLYRVMLFRALSAKKTRLLYLPKELVTYIAFDYRDNGTGKSLLEKSAMLFSMRAMTLVTRMTANINNSTTKTKVDVELDDDIVDPVARKHEIMSEFTKNRFISMPVGMLSISDLQDWISSVNYSFNFKHEDLPDINIETTETTGDKATPDTDLTDDIEEQIFMSFGLTKEIVQSGYDSDFATSVVAKHLLLAKRVNQLQNQFIPQINEHVRKIMRADDDLKEKIRRMVKSEYSNIKEILEKKIEAGDDKYKDIIKKEDLVVEYIVNQYCDMVETELPSPEMHEAASMKDAYESYMYSVDDYLDNILNEEAFTEDVIGPASNHIPLIKQILKMTIAKDWMDKNNYNPEMSNFLTIGDDGRPKFDALSDFNGIAENIGDVLKDFLSKNQNIVKDIEDKLSEFDVEGGDSSSSSSSDSGGFGGW